MSTSPGERDRVPAKPSTARCTRCGAAIIWTSAGEGVGRRVSVPLDAATVEDSASGVKWGRDHRGVCQSGAWPLTMEFPTGALEPLANPASRLPNGDMAVTFANRWALYDCLVVTGFARSIGAHVDQVEQVDGVTRLVVKPY